MANFSIDDIAKITPIRDEKNPMHLWIFKKIKKKRKPSEKSVKEENKPAPKQEKKEGHIDIYV